MADWTAEKATRAVSAEIASASSVSAAVRTVTLRPALHERQHDRREVALRAQHLRAVGQGRRNERGEHGGLRPDRDAVGIRRHEPGEVGAAALSRGRVGHRVRAAGCGGQDIGDDRIAGCLRRKPGRAGGQVAGTAHERVADVRHPHLVEGVGGHHSRVPNGERFVYGMMIMPSITSDYDKCMADFDDLDFDVQTLRVVKAIADEGSLTAAAEALGYSQPALSQQMRRLEQRLGVPIVERAGRRVRLTEAGRVLARHAPAVTTALDAAAGELAELRGLRSGRVRLAGFPSASPTLVPRLLADLAEHHPGITVTYLEAEPPEAVEAVRDDRVDIALTFSYPGDRDDPHRLSARGLTVQTIGRDELLAVLPVGHRAAAARIPRPGVARERGLDRGMPALPRPPPRGVRPRRLRAPDHLRDRQRGSRRGSGRAGDRRGDPAAARRRILPADAGNRDAGAPARRRADAACRHRAGRRSRAFRTHDARGAPARAGGRIGGHGAPRLTGAAE